MANTDDPKSLLKLAQALTSRVQIEGVTLVESQVKRNLDVPIPDEICLSYNFQVQTGWDDDYTKVRVIVTFRLSGDSDKGEADKDSGGQVFSIVGGFALYYKIESNEGVDDRNVEAFGRMNGTFNAWPYWRELVHSSLARLGLPPVTVPVLTVGALEKIFAEQDKENAEKAATENKSLSLSKSD